MLTTQIPKLLEEAEKHRRVMKVYWEHTTAQRSTLNGKGIEAAINPRRNSRRDTPSEARRVAVSLYRRLGHKAWTKLKGYCKRWIVETVYSNKGALREYCMAKTPESRRNS